MTAMSGAPCWMLLAAMLSVGQGESDADQADLFSELQQCRSKLCAWRKEKSLPPVGDTAVDNSVEKNRGTSEQGGTHDFAGSSEESEGMRSIHEFDDNQDLPIHPSRIALLVSGLTQPVTSLMLGSVMREIVQPLGSDGVHVFVHTTGSFTKDWDVEKLKACKGNASDDAVAEIYTSVLGGCLRTLVIDQQYHSAEKVYKGKTSGTKCAGQARAECVLSSVKGEQIWLPRFWHDPNPVACRMQFYRLRELYPHVLAEEKMLRSRYSHLVRLRTDTIWYGPWDFKFVADIDPQSRTVALPRGDASGSDLVPDSFWITSRVAARSAFSGFADFLQQPIDRKDIFDLFNCSWPGEGAGGSEHEHHASAAAGGLASANCDERWDDKNSAFCREQILVPGAIWPETLVKYYFRKRFDVIDSCGLMGRYVSVQGWFKGALDIADVCKFGKTSPYHSLSLTLLLYQVNSMLQGSTFDVQDGLEMLEDRLRSMAGDHRQLVLSVAARMGVDISHLGI